MRLLIGNFKGPKGDQGPNGLKGSTGETGQRGSRWTSGTAITGTNTIGTQFPDSGITDALVHDYYVNVDTGNVYECVASGTADVAEWTHVGNIKGPTGATGPAGSISDINDQKPTFSEAAKLENINNGETIGVIFGKFKKAISVLISHYMNKATASILGHVKLSNSSAITIAGEYALDAIEKNASVEGTLANLIAQQNSNLIFKTYTVNVSTNFTTIKKACYANKYLVELDIVITIPANITTGWHVIASFENFPYNIRQRIIRYPVTDNVIGTNDIRYRDVNIYEHNVNVYLENGDGGKKLIINAMLTI